MHEYSICRYLVDMVEEVTADRSPPPRIVTVHVAVGRLRQVIPDFLQTAYGFLTRETIAEGSALEIREVPVTVRCRSCGWEGEVEGVLAICGACQSVDLEHLTGDELILERIEIEE
jgi:hydrogenase nickel incorporation protein HypA/HybF